MAYAPVAVAATGGTPPFQWTVGAGALPGGLTLSSDGSVSGTPTAGGSFNFTAHVADTGGLTADVTASISIAAAPSASLTSACAQYCAVEQGCDSSCGAFGSLSGGTAPYSYAVLGGYVPHGVSVSGLALAGTFTAPAKFWQFTVQVTDALGATTTITPTFYVYPHISLSGGTCSRAGQTCTVDLAFSGGTPGGTPTLNFGSFIPTCTTVCSAPPLSITSKVGSGVVSVTMTAPNGSQGTFSLTLTDQSPCSAGVYCASAAATLTVAISGG